MYGPFFFAEQTVTGTHMMELWLMPQLEEDHGNNSSFNKMVQ
jgi:hypothetical protein